MADFNAMQHLRQQFMAEAQPIEQGYKSERDALLMATMSKYKVNNPARLPVHVQGALNQKLTEVKNRWSSKGNAIAQKYRPKILAMQEVDKMAQAGGMAMDPEMVKAKMVLPSEVYETMRGPQSKPLRAQADDIQAELDEINRGMKQFLVKAPREEGTYSQDTWKIGDQFDDPGGVAPEVHIRTGRQAGREQFEGKEMMGDRPANQSELRQWATLEARRQFLMKEQQRIGQAMLSQSQERTTNAPKDTGAGTFGTKATENMPKQKSRQELLEEYRKLGGSSTAEGRAFADKHLAR